MTNYEVIYEPIEVDPKKMGMIKNIGDGKKVSGNLYLMDKAIYDKVIEVQRMRSQIMENAITIFLLSGVRCGKPELDILPLVLDYYPDGREVLRVRAGPYWPEGQSGAGPVVFELPPWKIKKMVVEK